MSPETITQTEAAAFAAGQQAAGRYEHDYPIDLLIPSPTNPRKTFPEASMRELVASVRAMGIIQPILTMPRENGFMEIVCGERRYRAALEAGLEAVPIVIRELTEAAALEIQFIENVQREDVHPLEEAEGFRALIERAAYSAGDIALKIGKEKTYVYQRLRLNNLIEPLKKKFWDTEINLDQAIQLARLTERDQAEAVNTDWALESARETRSWIERVVMLDLQKAPFPTDDAKLLPKAGDCLQCPKRTGFEPALFPELTGQDRCTDRKCFEAKLDAFVKIRVKQSQAAAKKAETPAPVHVSTDYNFAPGKTKGDVMGPQQYTVIEKKTEKCPHREAALVVDGSNRGRDITICRDPKCPVHRGRGGVNYTRSAKELEEDRKRRQEAQTIAAGRRAVLMATIHAGTAAARGRIFLSSMKAEILLIAKQLFRRLEHEDRKQVSGLLGVEPAKEKGLPPDYGQAVNAFLDSLTLPDSIFEALLTMTLVPSETRMEWVDERTGGNLLDQAAKIYGLDPEAIATETRQTIEAAAAEKATKREKKTAKADAKPKAADKITPADKPGPKARKKARA